jgi:hypothetical protein
LHSRIQSQVPVNDSRKYAFYRFIARERLSASTASPLDAGLYYPWGVEFNSNNPGEIIAKLIELRQEHRDLDLAIERLAENVAVDQLQLTRLKKRKLKLKDWISYLESKLIPDIDA